MAGKDQVQSKPFSPSTVFRRRLLLQAHPRRLQILRKCQSRKGTTEANKTLNQPNIFLQMQPFGAIILHLQIKHRQLAF